MVERLLATLLVLGACGAEQVPRALPMPSVWLAPAPQAPRVAPTVAPDQAWSGETLPPRSSCAGFAALCKRPVSGEVFVLADQFHDSDKRARQSQLDWGVAKSVEVLGDTNRVLLVRAVEGDYKLELRVPKGALVPRLAKGTRVRYADGTAVGLKPGTMLAKIDGRVVALQKELRRLDLRLHDDDVAWYFTPGDAPELGSEKNGTPLACLSNGCHCELSPPSELFLAAKPIADSSNFTRTDQAQTFADGNVVATFDIGQATFLVRAPPSVAFAQVCGESIALGNIGTVGGRTYVPVLAGSVFFETGGFAGTLTKPRSLANPKRVDGRACESVLGVLICHDLKP